MTSNLAAIDEFISRWHAASGNERANYQIFLAELCVLLDLPGPDPAREDTRDNAYVFEHRVTFRHGDGSESHGFIDCYRRGAFVLEAKKLRNEGRAFDDAMLRARGQAEQYARALPAAEGRPPFLVVVDVGNAIELYAEFTRSGATYTPYPDPRSHRTRLADLRDEAVRNRLRQVWLDPLSLDPGRHAARVTREIAVQLAEIARTLEGAGHPPELVAGFLTRSLFTMFAEDIGLLPKRAFLDLLEGLQDRPEQLIPLVGELWKAMDAGRFSVAIRADVLRFNGKIFKESHVLPLDREQIGLLLQASRSNWREVEPAIFGTLLERALSPEERHKLGAHFTPRAYVERLVLPTVIEPLRADWQLAHGAALVLSAEGKTEEALATIRAFHRKLCEVKVLDPACGTGNFLYVTLEHLKRLEGEVLNAFDALDPARQAVALRQGGLALEGERANPFGDATVDPHQLLGIEINPRAAAIAELVLWIGYLQWHFRTRGEVMPAQPVIRDFHNIECRDAVLAYDRVEYVTDERGVPVSRWDGRTYKKHPVTGEDVPDDSARVPVERYVNPRKAEWPAADFVVGNPPFIGTKRMRHALGDGYVDAIRATWNEVPESADLVMYWWHQAAEQARRERIQRFGLITTNSLRQTFNRKVIESQMRATPPLSIVYAIPDHPWVNSEDGAAVRIAMTVAGGGNAEGAVGTVVRERDASDAEVVVEVEVSRGKVQADLRVGANLGGCVALRSNAGISGMGVALHGSGFILDPSEAELIRQTGPSVIRGYVGGRDLLQVPRERYLVDFSGMTLEQARMANPAALQRVVDYVKPERDHNNRRSIRELWWRFGWERPLLREALISLGRYVGTTETAKHRVFQFLPGTVLADHMVVCFALDDALYLGVLASGIHVTWALAAGGRLGVGNDPRYNKSRCFETFPFPAPSGTQAARIRDLADQLDAHRKRQQAQYPDLTLTGMYNVLEKLKAGDALTAKEKVIHEHGLVSVLKQLHDELDLAVLEAYGWSDVAPLMQMVNGNSPLTPQPLPSGGEEGNGAPGSTPMTREDAKRALGDVLLTRLVALNAERAAEEKRGLVRWLRPEFQAQGETPAPQQVEIEVGEEEAVLATVAAERMPWPRELPEQVRRVADVLATARVPLTEDAIASHFSGRGPWKRRLPQIVETLVSLGRARRVEAGRVLGAD